MRLLLNAILSLFIYSHAHTAQVPHRIIAPNEPWPTYTRQLYPQGIKLSEEISLLHQNVQHFKTIFDERASAKKILQEKKESLLSAIQEISEENQRDERITNPFVTILRGMNVPGQDQMNNAETENGHLSSAAIAGYYNNLMILKTLLEQKNDPYVAYYDLSEFVSPDFHYQEAKKNIIRQIRFYQKGEIPIDRIVQEMKRTEDKVHQLFDQIEERSTAFKNLVKFQALTSKFDFIFSFSSNADA